MTRLRLIAIGAMCLVGAAIVVKVARDVHVASQAEEYRQQAIKEASASTSAGDARAWLERNGFEVALYDDNVASEMTRQTSQGEETFNVVSGYRRTYGGRWVELVFLFGATQDRFVPGGFLEVEVNVDSPPSKAMLEEFARRAATARARTTSAGS
jgi:hypothetical protein